jgi:ferredoxin
MEKFYYPLICTSLNMRATSLRSCQLACLVLFFHFQSAFVFHLSHRLQTSLTPTGSQLSAQKFDPSDFIHVSLLKPMGLSLEEVEQNSNRGVMVDEVNSGSAKLNGKIYKGLLLLSANGRNLRNESFDSVLAVLASCPASDPVELVFIDPRNVFRGPALITVQLPGGDRRQIAGLKGQMIRDVLMSANVNVHGDRAKLTNCGGGGQCGTCAVLIDDTEDWEPRVEREALRLGKYASNSRLSCFTTIEGDCTVTISPTKINA